MTLRIMLHDDGRAEIDGRDFFYYLAWRSRSGCDLVVTPCDVRTEPTLPPAEPKPEPVEVPQ